MHGFTSWYGAGLLGCLPSSFRLLTSRRLWVVTCRRALIRPTHALSHRKEVVEMADLWDCDVE
jgi:hypothetical protein